MLINEFEKSVIPMVRGRYSREQIEIVHRDIRGMLTTPSQNEEIERIWSLQCARNRTLFDGLQVRLDSWRKENNELAVNTSLTSYREFVGTNLSHPEWGDDFMANPIGVSGLIRTRDNFLIFGIRGSKVAEYSGCVDTIGGNLSPVLHLTNGKIDPFRAFTEEICEELTVAKSQIDSVAVTGLWRNAETLRPEIVFRADLLIDRDSVQAIGGEHSELLFVPQQSVELHVFIVQNQGKITPSCMAALIDLIE